jgi:hypothetical protein
MKKLGEQENIMTRIVASGRDNILRSEGYAKRVVEIRREVQQRHAAELAGVSWWKRFMLRAKIEREIRREVENLAPPHALYIKREGQL